MRNSADQSAPPSAQWVIKLPTDQIKGPYSTAAVIKMISSGIFLGNEKICAYPEGEWRLLTKQAEFYDALLESLENPVVIDNKKAQKMDAETVIQKKEDQHSPIKNQIESPSAKIESLDDLKEFLENERNTTDKKLKQKAKKMAITRFNHSATNRKAISPIVAHTDSRTQTERLTADRHKNFEIQLIDIKKLKQQELKKILPFVFIGLFLTVTVLYFLLPIGETARAGWPLIAPQKNTTELSAEELINLKRQAVKAFQGGLLEQIFTAQKSLVQAAEGAPKDLETLGLLCMAYEQLWPYTKQTPEDFKSIAIVTQMARSINPISNYSDTCQAVYLLTKGQSNEARSLLEKALDNPVDEKFSLSSFLYLVKAEILESENKFLYASAYYEQAAKLWPTWITAKFGLGRSYYKQNKFAEAREQYVEIYKKNKESKAALFGLALLELKGTKDIDKALTYFASGFEKKESLPKEFLTEALFSYAQVLVEKNESKRALTVAQEAYRHSPGHRGLKEMVILLGGDDKVENAQAEIILIGDQFARAGNHMVAQAQYKVAFEVDPKNAMAAYKAAKSLWQINQSRDAIGWLEKSIKANPKLLQSYILLADYESQKFNFSKAAKTLQIAFRFFPQNHEIIKAQALLEFRKNNMLGAIQYGERAVKIYSADVELLSLLAQAHIYYYMNGPSAGKDAQAKKNNSKEMAARYAGRAIEIEPAWPEGQISFAKVLSGVYGPVKAETFLKEKIKEYPYTLEYRIALAELYRENEKFRNAAMAYEEIISIDAKNKKANFGLAEAYRILNKPDLAQQYYNLTSALDPSDVEPMLANAKLLLETATGSAVKAKTEQALAKLELVKKINPEFPKVSFLMAKCYLELNDYAKALEMAREEKARNPMIADSYILMAEIFNRKSQFKECAAEYSTAIKLRPHNAELYVKAAACYRNSDAIDIAEDMLGIALQKESGYAEIYREQAYIFEKKNNRGAAVLSFEKYLMLSPNALDREIVEAKIKELGG